MHYRLLLFLLLVIGAVVYLQVALIGRSPKTQQVKVKELEVFQKQEVTPLWTTDEAVRPLVDGELSADIVSDGTQIHAVWQTGTAFYHSRTSIDGMTWEAPRKLTVPLEADTSFLWNGGPRLLFTEQALVIFYGNRLQRLASNDLTGRGDWQLLPPILEVGEYAAQFDAVANANQVIIAAATSVGTLDVWSGSSRGPKYLKRQLVGPAGKQELYPVVKPSITMNKGRIDIVWARSLAPKPGSSGSENKLYHFQSTDGGVSWTTNDQVALARNVTGPITSVKVIQTPSSKPKVFYISGTTLFMGQPDGTAIEVSLHNPKIMEAVGGEAPRVFWVDSRFHGEEWWGKIPFHQLFRPSDTPNWRNNDLFMFDLQSRSPDEANERRLTQPLSYTTSIRAIIQGDRAYVIRVGRRKVGYTIDQFGHKPEVFIHQIPL